MACLAAVGIAAPAMARSFREQPTLDAMIARSDAIVVCNVVSVDERASLDPSQPLTSVKCAVDELLRGQLPAAQNKGELELLFRGGITTEGLRLRFSSVPALSAGERYLMFLRSDYYVSPILPVPQGLIREVSVGGAPVAVDESGRAIVASRNFGLVTAGKVTRALDEVTKAAVAAPITGNSSAPEDSAAAQAQPAASSFASVRELIRGRAARAPAPGAAVLETAPLSLPSAAPQSSPSPATSDVDTSVTPAGATQGEGQP